MFKELSQQYPQEVSEIEKEWARLPQPPVDINYVNKQCEANEQLEKLYSEVLDYFYKYTEIVCKYQRYQLRMDAKGGAERADIENEGKTLDEERHVTHNAMIDSVNILARAQQQSERDGAWIQKLTSRVQYALLAMTTVFKILLQEKENNDK